MSAKRVELEIPEKNNVEISETDQPPGASNNPFHFGIFSLGFMGTKNQGLYRQILASSFADSICWRIFEYIHDIFSNKK